MVSHHGLAADVYLEAEADIQYWSSAEGESVRIERIVTRHY